MRTLLIALCVALPSCVTINIYFPEAAAERAADQIIDEVWQIKPGESEKQQTPPEEPRKP
jgi:hypothetical protein